MTFVLQLKALVRELDPDAATAEETALGAFIRDLSGTQRAAAVVSTALAAFGVVLLAIGCVSLFLSMVKDSLREIAIRMALGATSGTLTRWIVAQGLVLIAAGLAIGLAVARVLAMKIADQLYKTKPTDLGTFVMVPAVIALVGMAAVAYSALVATRTDPAKLLQTE